MTKIERKVYRHQWYLKHRAEEIERGKLWSQANPEKHLASVHHWMDTHPVEYKLKNTRHNRKLTPQKRKGYNYIARYPEATRTECEICGNTKNLVAHHPDYEYPKIVVTLCRPCYMVIHFDKGIKTGNIDPNQRLLVD